MPRIILIPTPVGNLEDITLRALRLLREAGLMVGALTGILAGLLAEREVLQEAIYAWEAHLYRQGFDDDNWPKHGNLRWYADLTTTAMSYGSKGLLLDFTGAYVEYGGNGYMITDTDDGSAGHLNGANFELHGGHFYATGSPNGMFLGEDGGRLHVVRAAYGHRAEEDKHEGVGEAEVGQRCAHGHGYGHGVGLSQWGAHSMAEAGRDYREILSHYYSGVQVQTLAELAAGTTSGREETPVMTSATADEAAFTSQTAGEPPADEGATATTQPPATPWEVSEQQDPPPATTPSRREPPRRIGW